MKYLVFDFSRVILFPKDINYKGSLNKLYKSLTSQGPINFFDEYYLNHELLNFLENKKDKFHLIIFTSGELHSHKDVSPNVTFFGRVIKTSDLGVEKSDTKAFQKLCEVLNCNPSEIFFVDDNLDNINAAKAAGLEVFLYENNEQLFEFINKAES